MLSTRDPPQNKRYTQTKSKGMEKDMLCKWKEKDSVSIVISDKINFKTKATEKDREGHYIMIKQSNKRI